MLKKRGEETEEYYCPNNFEGSSKSMKAYSIQKMVEDSFYIDGIIIADESTMQAVLKHSSKGAQGQVLKSPKGTLDE